MENLTEVQAKIANEVKRHMPDYLSNSIDLDPIIESIQQHAEVSQEIEHQISEILGDAQREMENFKVGPEGATNEDLAKMEEEIDKPVVLEIAKLF